MKKNFYSGLVLGIIFSFLISLFIIYRVKNVETFKVKASKTDFEIAVTGSTIESDSVLTYLFSKHSTASEATNWLADNEGIYGIHDYRLEKVIKSLDYEDSLSDAIRRIQIEREGPWNVTAEIGYIAIPKVKYADFIPDDHILTWDNNLSLINRKLRLYDTTSNGHCVVFCTSGMGNRPKNRPLNVFQINKKTALKLFAISGQLNAGDILQVYVTPLNN